MNAEEMWFSARRCPISFHESRSMQKDSFPVHGVCVRIDNMQIISGGERTGETDGISACPVASRTVAAVTASTGRAGAPFNWLTNPVARFQLSSSSDSDGPSPPSTDSDTPRRSYPIKYTTTATTPCGDRSFIINTAIIRHSNEVKYLGLTFDRRLTGSPHLKDKRKKLNSRLYLLRPLLRSNLTMPIKIILYKTLLQPIWTHGIVVRGSTKTSNKRNIQSFQNICQRLITGAPWFVSNATLNSDLKLPSTNETAATYNKRFRAKLQCNPNQLINDLASLTLL
ncbi:Hypothetical protein CINCED_3A018632, partial [Cinara cedri]